MNKKNILFWAALVGALVFIYLLILNFGGFSLMGKLNEPNLGYGLIFIIGLLASFHCVGMCGGFIASYSAKQLESGCAPTRQSHWQYNLGRFISYTLSGALLGVFGSAFQINSRFSGALLLIAGLFMSLMGLKLLTGGRFLSGIKFKLPAGLVKFIYKNNQKGSPKAPFLIGLLTALMPCGPLQAMQLYALTTGNFWEGALSMAFYAAGTIPIMFLFGSLISSLSASKIKNVLKISGGLVLALGLITASRGFSDSGLQRQVSKPINQIKGEKDISAEQYFSNSIPTDKYQTVEMEINSSGFKPNIIKIKKGLPVRWIIKDGGATGCTNEVILYNSNQELRQKIASPQTIIKFMPAAEQTEIRFSCWMKMVWGKFIID